ncbi:MAG: bifunctional DedA family/phosphatase PAP2 family protein [Sulfurospirillum sp.]
MNIHYILEQFFNWISSYPSNMVLTILILIILIASILESLPIVGMMFPSETLTIFFGILAFKGIVDIRILIITAYIGILAGDIFGYYLGEKVGEDFLKKHAKRLKINSKKYEQIKDGLDDNLIKVLFIGRSNGFTRWIAPFLAGANGMSLKKFIPANMLTAAFWAPAFLLGGYYLGSAFENYGKYFGVGIIAATILSIIIYKTYKHFENNELLQRDDFKLFIINIFGLYLFSKMAEDVLDLELVTKLDIWISSTIPQIYTPIFTKTMILITSVDNPLPISFIILSICLYMGYKKWYRDILFFLSSLFGSVVLMFVVKIFVQRPRPELHIIEVSGYSFPSGHATISTALAFALYFILKEKMKYKKILLILSIIYPLLISFSRVYLNVHYLSDVVAGIGLALFWVSLVALAFEIIRVKNETKI